MDEISVRVFYEHYPATYTHFECAHYIECIEKWKLHFHRKVFAWWGIKSTLGRIFIRYFWWTWYVMKGKERVIIIIPEWIKTRNLMYCHIRYFLSLTFYNRPLYSISFLASSINCRLDSWTHNQIMEILHNL